MGVVRVPSRIAIAGVAVLAAATALTVNAGPAGAAATTRYVATTGSDTDNDCTDHSHPCQTIGYAVGQANAGDTVSIAAGKYDESVDVRLSLTLVGAGTSGANKTTIDGDSSGNASITVDGVDTETTPDVTIRNLDVSGNADNDGIQVNTATATVEDSVVDNNSSDGIDAFKDSTLHVTASTVSGNGNSGVGADGTGSGSVTLSGDVLSDNAQSGLSADGVTVSAEHVTASDNGDGGAVLDAGTATITTSTFNHNAVAGIADLGGTLTLSDSTVSNTLAATSGDSAAYGSGILGFFGATITVSDSTLYKNTGQGAISVLSDVTVRNSTVSGTQPAGSAGTLLGLPDAALANVGISAALRRAARQAGTQLTGRSAAISRDAIPEAGTLTAIGTLIAGNVTPACTSTGTGPEGATTEPVTDGGYNLSDDNSCAFSATGSKNNGVGKLGPFGSHGGPTKTLVPAKGSDAIDTIPSGTAGCTSDATDQRGEPRLQGSKCDIGSVEVAQTPLIVKPAKLPHGKVGHAYHVTLTASGGLGAPYTFTLASGTLPHGVTLSSDGVLSGTPKQSGDFPVTIAVDDPVLKHYVLVIAAAPAPSSPAPSTSPVPPTTAPPSSVPAPSNSAGPLANTGARVGPLLTVGGFAIGLGVLLLVAGAVGAGRKRRNRPAH